MATTPWRRIEAWIDALLPAACAGCGAALGEATPFCADCALRLDEIPADACSHCQLHARWPDGRCPRSGDGDPLDGAVASVWLTSPVSEWIHAFKYPARGLAGLAPGPIAAARELAARAVLHARGPHPDLVVPVPLHRKRLRNRGFNPALELARAVGRAAERRVDATALERTRDTPTQTGLDAIARRRNLDAAMRARRSMPPCVWVVDDVLTTGATVREAARALRTAGAERVVALAAARTPLD